MTAIQSKEALPRFVPYTNSSNFSITYEASLSDKDLLEKITTIPQAHVVMWYIGAHGLKEEGVTFYKDKINKILSNPNTSSCWLMDLTAWGAFHNPKNKITTSSCCLEQISSFNINKLKCISAAFIFQKMQAINSPVIIDYFKNHIVKRKDLLQRSDHFKEVGNKIRKVFDEKCPIFEEIYEYDTSKCYSIMQYVEGCMLIEQIVQQNLDHDHDINIIFALPNDEYKYYYDDDHHFIKDVETILKDQFNKKLESKKINIYFLNFSYGEALNQRPYNSGKKVVKALTRDMIF